MIKRFFILIIIFISFLGTNTFAQVHNSDITLNVTPNSPKANDNVRANITSYIINTKSAYFVWRVDEEIKSTGIGKDSFSFNLGSLNSQTTLSVTVDTTEGKTYNQSMTFYGAEVDLLWEAVDSYVPPFYKGKTLVAKEGEFKIVAMPSIYSQNQKINPNTLSYTWTKDGNGQQLASGFGKSSFVYKNSFIDNANEIQVEVSNINKQITVANDIILAPFAPKVLFYKKDAFGIRTEKALNNDFFIQKEGDNIAVAPYFFSPKNINSADLKVDWFLNNAPIVNPKSKTELPIKPETDKSGTAVLKVIISNLKTLYQESEKTINVNF
ncbi:MAG: hypothetical protein WC011_04260 [Candidatus Paceibacterota bacterium]